MKNEKRKRRKFLSFTNWWFNSDGRQLLRDFWFLWFDFGFDFVYFRLWLFCDWKIFNHKVSWFSGNECLYFIFNNDWIGLRELWDFWFYWKFHYIWFLCFLRVGAKIFFIIMSFWNDFVSNRVDIHVFAINLFSVFIYYQNLGLIFSDIWSDEGKRRRVSVC